MEAISERAEGVSGGSRRFWGSRATADEQRDKEDKGDKGRGTREGRKGWLAVLT
jgi:hypothetical protein